MKNWREILQKLVESNGSEEFPLLVFSVSEPAGMDIDEKLPVNDAIRDFYSICDGGVISLQYTFFDQGSLVFQNKQWQQNLHNYHDDDTPVLLPDRHLVIGLDSGGAPLIWDSLNDCMATFFSKGDWEPIGYTFDEFMGV